jgi:hypothetical protein
MLVSTAGVFKEANSVFVAVNGEWVELAGGGAKLEMIFEGTFMDGSLKVTKGTPGLGISLSGTKYADHRPSNEFLASAIVDANGEAVFTGSSIASGDYRGYLAPSSWIAAVYRVTQEDGEVSNEVAISGEYHFADDQVAIRAERWSVSPVGAATITGTTASELFEDNSLHIGVRPEWFQSYFSSAWSAMRLIWKELDLTNIGLSAGWAETAPLSHYRCFNQGTSNLSLTRFPNPTYGAAYLNAGTDLEPIDAWGVPVPLNIANWEGGVIVKEPPAIAWPDGTNYYNAGLADLIFIGSGPTYDASAGTSLTLTHVGNTIEVAGTPGAYVTLSCNTPFGTTVDSVTKPIDATGRAIFVPTDVKSVINTLSPNTAFEAGVYVAKGYPQAKPLTVEGEAYILARGMYAYKQLPTAGGYTGSSTWNADTLYSYAYTYNSSTSTIVTIYLTSHIDSQVPVSPDWQIEGTRECLITSYVSTDLPINMFTLSNTLNPTGALPTETQIWSSSSVPGWTLGSRAIIPWPASTEENGTLAISSGNRGPNPSGSPAPEGTWGASGDYGVILFNKVTVSRV